MSLFKSNWEPVRDKQHMPTLYYRLRGGALNQHEILFKDIRMAIPQLDMKEISFLVYMKITWDVEKKNQITKYFFSSFK